MTLEEEQQKLLKIISTIKNTTNTAGSLKIQCNHKAVQYLQVINSKATYIKKENIELAKALAQKKYNALVQRQAEQELQIIGECLNKRNESCIADIYTKLSPEMKKLITPYDMPDKDFVNSWLKTPYMRKAMEEGTKFFVTERGDKVRSKSECIIADRLYAKGIPYRYEQKHILHEPFTLRQLVFYPDFTILKPHTREEIIWEHFGLMSNQEYTDNAIGKISLYNQNGYHQGKNIIYTFESTSNPLQPNDVTNIIKTVFL